MDKIWFRQEAKDWNEAIPVGNGFLGAMVFGKTDTERIQINEDSVWSGGFMERINPDAKENLSEIRELLSEGRIEAAERLTEYSMYATTPHMRHYQTLGDVWIHFFKQKGKKVVKKVQGNLLNVEYEGEHCTEYQRELNLDDALGKVQYTVGNVTYQREFFASNPAQVIVYKMRAGENGKLNFDVSLTRKENSSGRGATYCDGVEVQNKDTIRLYGKQGGDDGIGFEFLTRVEISGGKKYRMGSRIVVEDAQEAILYITARTSYRSENPLLWCQKVLETAEKKGYAVLKEQHVSDYKKYYSKSILKLHHEDEFETLSTPERLERMRNGAEDIGLVNTYYNYAKYLLISSSREGSLPANLQGIWNEEFAPAWGSKYTINVNIQMNYWMAEKIGLGELHMPLLEHLKNMHPHGKQVAEKMYGMRGFCCHHNTDIWGDCAPQDNHVSSTIWPMGGAWLCLHLVEHYRYTGDKQFIKEYYEILKDSVLFFMDYLVLSEDGYWVSGPSSSPENIYVNEKGESGCVCMGTAMDSEIIRELFTGFLYITEELQYEEEIAAGVKEKLQRLQPLQIGKYGQIQEWSKDYEEIEPGHRHISQLFALYPAEQIRMDKTPELAQAAKRTIERRLKFGGGHTGWSKAWILLFYARLWDAEQAWENLQDLLKNLTLNNLFNNHPPFQIDGNFGGACGLLEMLIQDYGDKVYLLPSLPKALKKGEVNGIRLKNGSIFSMKWDEGKVTEIEISAERDSIASIWLKDRELCSITLKKGQTVFFDKNNL